MKILFMILASLGLSATAWAQSSDYCFQYNKNTTPLHDAVCLDSQIGFLLGREVAKATNKYYRQLKVQPEYEGQWSILDSGFAINENQGELKYIQRIGFALSKNLSFFMATKPYGINGDVDFSQIVIIIKTDGETSLVCEGVFKKKKLFTNNNVSKYSVEPTIKEAIIGGKKITLDIEITYLQGIQLFDVRVGDVTVAI